MTLSASASPDRSPFAYESRRLLADPVLTVGGCRYKPYRIAHPGPDALAEVQAFDLQALLEHGMPAPEPGDHDAGFAVLHQGRDGAYLLIARWNGGHNLGSRTYQVLNTAGQAPRLQALTLLACVWELAVYAHERDAWVRTVMTPGCGLDGVAAYLASRTEGWL